MTDRDSLLAERVALMLEDPAIDLTVDANAIAGLLETMFGGDVTAAEERCAHCGTVSLIGTLRVYLRGPGIVVRCPACTDVIVRIVHTPSGMRMDASGSSGISLRSPAA